MDDTTFVMGFWYVHMNKKHDKNHYLKTLPSTLALISGKPLVFFYDDDDIRQMVEETVGPQARVLFIRRSVEDLPTYALSVDYLQSCQKQDNDELHRQNDQKGLIHYKREYRSSGPDSFRRVFSIWTSKVFLVEEVAGENPFGTRRFAWMDASFSRFNQDPSLLHYDDERFNTIHNSMRFRGQTLYSNASFLLASADVWSHIIPLYSSVLYNEASRDNYCHDEETLLFLVKKSHPDLFAQFTQQGKEGFSEYNTEWNGTLVVIIIATTCLAALFWLKQRVRRR
jgi:hypothetical protein